MRRIHIWATLITGIPMGLLIAAGPSPDTGALPLLLAAILCGALVGVPQGYLAARFVSRPNARRSLFLVSMLIAGCVMSMVGWIVAENISGVLPGRWVSLPGPPARVIGLIGPTNYRLIGQCNRDLYHAAMTVYVRTDNNAIYRFDEPANWALAEQAPEPDPPCTKGPDASTPQSQQVIVQWTVDCHSELHLELNQDGALRYWRNSRCAFGESDHWVVSMFFSLVAWLVVRRSQRLPSTAAP